MGSKLASGGDPCLAPEDRDPMPRAGRLEGIDEDGTLLVTIRGRAGKVRARRLLRMDRSLRQAVLDRRDVILLFEDGNPDKPIVAGVVQPDTEEPSPDTIESTRHPAGTPLVLEADADGSRVKLTARDEIVLQCGDASITLRRNGRLIIRGTDLESRASGQH